MATFSLRDGRKIDFLDNESPSAFAVVLHHGTPGDCSAWSEWLSDYADAGIRAIATSRPGYGSSDPLANRRVVDVVEDVAEILDSFGIEKFVAMGWSGGGPHALASALDPRCVGVISLAGVGKFNQPDLDFLAGMGPENIDEFGVAVQGRLALESWMAINALPMQSVTGAQIREAFGGLIGQADKAVLEGEYADQMASAMRRGLVNGFEGWVADDLAFTQDWGFELGDIDVPVALWQGDDDFMVPATHSRWLDSHLPNSTLRHWPGEGHISLGVNHMGEIVAETEKMLNR